jgi:hypothetical protein
MALLVGEMVAELLRELVGLDCANAIRGVNSRGKLVGQSKDSRDLR